MRRLPAPSRPAGGSGAPRRERRTLRSLGLTDPHELQSQRPTPIQVARSYLSPVVLEHRASAHNPHLLVRLVRGRLRLDAAHVNYSHGELHEVMDAAFRELNIRGRGVEQVLLLGLGAGSAVELLRKRDAPNAQITAIEIDPVVVELALRWFPECLDENIRIACADAADFVALSEERFDLIVVDLFIDEEVPSRCETAAFLTDCASRLLPGGLLMFNRLADAVHRQGPTMRFERVFLEALAGGSVVPVLGNRILVYEKPL